jgi:hypothetical protein
MATAVINAIGTPQSANFSHAARLMSRRTFYGHGSIYRGAVIAVQHVGYSLAEESTSDGTVATIGVVRGDPQVLRRMAQVNQELVLMLEDGRRLPFRLTEAQQDGGWVITVIDLPH